LTRKKYINYVRGLSDYELYSLAKHNIIGARAGLSLFDWQEEIIFNECESRNHDIHASAQSDAEMLIASRSAMTTGVNVSDIYRPSLMSRAEIAALLGGTNVNNLTNNQDADVLNSVLSGKSKNYLLCKVSGDSMLGEGIYENDMLIVERNTRANNKIIVASVNNELFVKRYIKDSTGEWLHSANDEYAPFKIRKDVDFRIIGLVKYIMHSPE